MKAVLFVGMQGSGKSSFFRERFYATHVRINRDMLKTAHREREFIETCLRTQQPFVVDEVNARREERSEYIDHRGTRFPKGTEDPAFRPVCCER